MSNSDRQIERRPLGSTGEELSVIGFGGVVVAGTSREDAANYVSEAVGRGINYFDVAPIYGNAQKRLGPALKPHRDKSFLACKTRERTAEGAERELNESLELLQTDHFDLYQLHGLMEVEEDAKRALGPGGALETFVKAREAGKIRYIGFSAHSEEAALAAMDGFDFDSILFPMNYFMWNHGGFGPQVFKRAREKGMGVLALKSCAFQTWPKEVRENRDHPWPKCWYEPLEEKERMALALRFTLGLPVDAAVPPGHWELFTMAMDIVSEGLGAPLSEEELAPLESMATDVHLLFKAANA